MTQHEFDQPAHDKLVDEGYRRIARVALFDELIDMHHDGQCSYDEAVAQFLHDANEDGIGFEVAE